MNFLTTHPPWGERGEGRGEREGGWKSDGGGGGGGGDGVEWMYE